jgi:hypothetical protein
VSFTVCLFFLCNYDLLFNGRTRRFPTCRKESTVNSIRGQFAVAGVVLLVGAFVLTMPSTGASAPPAPAANVNVVNTPTNPVPTAAQGTTAVTGSVDISGTPTVSLAAGTTVGISGTPTVGLASNARVAINSAATVPVFVRSVDDAVRELFHMQTNMTLADGDIGTTAFFHVPDGKRLIIEHVSASGIIPAGQKLQLNLSTLVNNSHQLGGSVQVTHFLVPQKLGVGDPTSIGGSGASIEIFNVSQPTRIYADADPANTSIVFSAGRGVSTGTGSVSISISGYYVGVS